MECLKFRQNHTNTVVTTILIAILCCFTTADT